MRIDLKRYVTILSVAVTIDTILATISTKHQVRHPNPQSQVVPFIFATIFATSM